MRFLDRRDHGSLVLLSGAVVLSGAGLLLGPVWAVAGALAGPIVALVAAAVVEVFTTTDPGMLGPDQHREALVLIDQAIPAARFMARIWPAQFQETLAHRLLDRSMALHAALRDGEALAASQQSLAIYRELAAARPGKYAADLARALNNVSYPLRAAGRQEEALAAADEAVQLNRTLAVASPKKHRYSLACSLGTRAELLFQAGRVDDALTSVTEAAAIYQDLPPGSNVASQAAEVLILQGQVLCDLSRCREAARPPALGWHLASSHERQNPGFARTVLQTAYDADPASFRVAWLSETGADLPGWLTDEDVAASPD